MEEYSGECLCGHSRYKITSKAKTIMYLCHCSRCRKETGTVHGANIFLLEANLEWEQGGNNITFFQIEGTKHARSFCKVCGSPMPREEDEKSVVLPAGSLDEDSWVEPAGHIFCDSRSGWEDKLVNAPRFGELPK